VVADVAILGGGFAGLWTAVALTERDPGIRIAIVEQDIVGGGASGRNGGFFSSSWHDLAGLVGQFGERDGLRYALALADAVHGAAAFVEANAIPCAFHVEGVLGAIAEEWQRADDDDTLAIAERLGVADRLHELDAAGARAIADSPRFVGGAFVADNAICQPARLARGLRRLVLERGVHVFERTRARAIEPGRPVIVRTDLGAVKAGQVVVTTGAWAAGSPWFRRSFGVISDYVVATEPIPDLLEEIGWTTNVGIGDRRDWLYYLRPTDDRRIVIGGGEGGAVFGGRAGGRAATHAHRYARAAARGLGCCSPSSGTCDSPTRGVDPSIRRRRSCRSSGRSNRARSTRVSASAVTASRRPTSAGRSSPRRSSAPRTSGPRSRSTVPNRPSRPPSRSAIRWWPPPRGPSGTVTGARRRVVRGVRLPGS
jgi:glycine/D-amino acid oxidase-like deaminating enzyme